MGAIPEAVAIALIAAVAGVITAIVGAARTAARPPAEPGTGKPSAYTVKLDDEDRDALAKLTDTIDDLVKGLNELRHELMRRR